MTYCHQNLFHPRHVRISSSNRGARKMTQWSERLDSKSLPPYVLGEWPCISHLMQCVCVCMHAYVCIYTYVCVSISIYVYTLIVSCSEVLLYLVCIHSLLFFLGGLFPLFCNVSLHLLMFFTVKSITSDRIDFLPQHENILFHSFTFNFHIALLIRCVSCRQLIDSASFSNLLIQVF